MDWVHVPAQEEGAKRMVIVYVVLQGPRNVHIYLPLEKTTTFVAKLALFLIDDPAEGLSSIKLFLPLQVLNFGLFDRSLLCPLILLVVLALLAHECLFEVYDPVAHLVDSKFALFTENDRIEIVQVRKEADLACEGCLFQNVVHMLLFNGRKR